MLTPGRKFDITGMSTNGPLVVVVLSHNIAFSAMHNSYVIVLLEPPLSGRPVVYLERPPMFVLGRCGHEPEKKLRFSVKVDSVVMCRNYSVAVMFN